MQEITNRQKRIDWILKSIEGLSREDATRFLDAELQIAFFKGRTSVFEQSAFEAKLQYTTPLFVAEEHK